MRFKRTEDATGTWTTLYSMYEGEVPVMQEMYTNVGRIEVRYNVVVGGNILAQYRRVYPSTDSVVYFYLDNLGSRRVVKSSTPAVIDRIRYTPWGEAVYDVDSGNGYKNFTGKEYDFSKLLYFNARYYDPIVGRFITEDPSQDGTGWYTYCGNNPINAIDPTGSLDMAPPSGSNIGLAAPSSNSVAALVGPTSSGSPAPGANRGTGGDNGGHGGPPSGIGGGGDKLKPTVRDAIRAIIGSIFPKSLPSIDPRYDSIPSDIRNANRYARYKGEKVYALRAGIVVKSGWQNPGKPEEKGGWRISIDTGDGYVDFFGHLQEGSTLPVGTRVDVGDPIGTMGDPATGEATGPHVHVQRHTTVNNKIRTVDPGDVSGVFGPSIGFYPSQGYQAPTDDEPPHGGIDVVPKKFFE